MASRRPDLVRSLVLVEPALYQLAADAPEVAAMAEVVRREAWAGAAPVDIGVLAGASFPKLLVVGGKAPPAATGSVRAAGQALAEALVRRIGVEVVVFEGSGHLPPVEEPERFNDLLRATWAVPEPGGKW
jgi:pimeloyl-ACP methyl ester carboxylesterase